MNRIGEAESPKSQSNIKLRLAASDWVEAALLIMARDGVSNVRIEVLAKKLNVTKGSFYWHFKDRNALLDATLELYETRACAYMQRIQDSAGSPGMQLKSILTAPQRISKREYAVATGMELAIRGWARRSVHVRKLVRRSDEMRREITLAILKAHGVRSDRAQAIGNLFQALLFHLWIHDELSASERQELIEVVDQLVKSSSSATTS